jgi:hypothetical protein
MKIVIFAALATALALALTDSQAQQRCCAERGNPTTCHPC